MRSESTHYDNYGHREVFRLSGKGTYSDTTRRTKERRYLLWVTNDGTGRAHTGQRRTYRTKSAAIRRAKRLAKRGLGVVVTDREIRPGDTGFLADRTGSYIMGKDGILHTGSFDVIARLRGRKAPH